MSLTDSARFLGALFSPYARSESLAAEIRCLPPARRGSCGPILWFDPNPESLTKAVHAASDLSGRWDVTVGVLPRTGGKGKRENVVSAAWLWADVDPGEDTYTAAIERVRNAPVIPKPHIAVGSGAGLHLYWKLADSVQLADDSGRVTFEMTLRRIARAIGGEAPGVHADRSVCKCNFLLRVPGTRNHKREREVRLIHFAPTAPSQPYSWWRANLPAEPLPVRRWRLDTNPTPREVRPLPGYVQELLQTPAAVGTRHHVALRLVTGAMRCGFGPDAVGILANHFCHINQFDPREMQDLINWAERRILCRRSD